MHCQSTYFAKPSNKKVGYCFHFFVMAKKNFFIEEINKNLPQNKLIVFFLVYVTLFLLMLIAAILTQLCANIFSFCLSHDNQKKNAVFYRHKKVQNFFSTSCEKFPTHHQHFFVLCLLSKKRRAIKYFMTTKKILFDVFSKTYFLCKEKKNEREKKGNCIFYFTQKKLLFV